MAKPKKLMGVQQNQLHCDVDTQAILTYLCEESNNLYNCGVYWARQIFFKTNRIVSKYDPIYAVGGNIHAQAMPSVAAQQTLLSVSEAFKSFRELRQLFFRGELDQKPKPPDYRDSGGLFKVSFPNIGAGKPTLENGMIRFPLGLQVKRWFGLKEFFLPLPIETAVLRLLSLQEFPYFSRKDTAHRRGCRDNSAVVLGEYDATQHRSPERAIQNRGNSRHGIDRWFRTRRHHRRHTRVRAGFQGFL